MPVTAKFSKEFYDRLGHKIADELVDWFNAVDTVYRSEFRELFEINFGRFDAKLEQRTAELKAEPRQEMAEMAEMKAELRQEIGGIRETWPLRRHGSSAGLLRSGSPRLASSRP